MLFPPPDPQTPPERRFPLPKASYGINGSKYAFSLTYFDSRLGGLNVVTRFVPPTAVTCGLDAKNSTPGRNRPTGTGGFCGGVVRLSNDGSASPPLSPELATNVMPWAFPCLNTSSKIFMMKV